MSTPDVDALLRELAGAFRALQDENATLRERLAAISAALGAPEGPGGAPVRALTPAPRRTRAPRAKDGDGASAGRGRPSRFTPEEMAEFRRRVEAGEIGPSALARELGVSLPTVYAYLKRAGWTKKAG